MNYELLIITGEDSGDLYGGNLAREIKKLSPDINISGVGGRQMKSAGVDIFCIRLVRHSIILCKIRIILHID